jgi:hypothetical protein
MRDPETDLEKQIDAAFHFRGDVTLRLTDGTSLVAYLYNREFSHRLLKEPPYVDVLKKGGARERIAIDRISGVTLSGTDHAAIAPPEPRKEDL